MSKLKNRKAMLIAACAMLLITAACKKTIEKLPEQELDAELMYRNVYDADAAVNGLYGKFLNMADEYILLNELRADMLEYTQNADEYIRQLSTHSVTPDNPYASPRPFYSLILDCNDILKNFDIMKADNKMNEQEYQQRYSDVGSLRSFLYLQLGIHYGSVPYVTSALETVDQIKDINKYPKITFDALLDSLINFTEALPYKDQYPTGTSMNISVDGYNTAKFFVNKKCLLGDLNLWKGNYVKAATWYRQVMEIATAGTAGARYYMQNKLGWNGSNEDHYITYSRANDATTLVYEPQWRHMFQRGQDNGFDYEWIWVLPFDSRFKPENPLINLFSPIGGSYLVKPSVQAMDYFNSQKQRVPSGQTGYIPYDARGIFTYRDIGGQPVVMKYLYNYINYATNTAVNPFQKNGKWFLFRQTHLHLHFAEAANRAGQPKLAYSFFNSGLAGTYPLPSGVTDVTLYHNTLDLPYPFNFDGRNSGGTGVPYYRADWYRNIGIRARANIQNYVLAGVDSTLEVENGLIQEGALENGFEGTRWPDLVRVALRRNDPAFLADKIYDKLRKDGVGDAAAVRAKLMNKENWYLPFSL